MRARIRTSEFTLEFDGDSSIWNDILRPVLGGPEATSEAPVAVEPLSAEAAGGPMTPGGAAGSEPAAGPAQARGPARTDAAVTIEPTAEPRELYRRLGDAGGRRSEKDAIVAAVWFVAGATGDATAEEVQAHLVANGAFADTRVKPVMLKHVSRSRLLENTERKGAVRLTEKGREYVRSRLVGSSSPSG